MAVQIQLRRDTASNWTSNNPTLAQGEFAIETDTDKYKIGDGSTAWTSLGYSSLPSNAIASTGGTFTGAITINGASPIVLEGATADAYETTIAVTDPTADRTLTLPDSTGTVALTTDNVASATLAATATALANARTIGGVSFDGTANISLPGVNASGTQDTSGNATTATQLAASVTIGGVTFTGAANINLPGVNAGGSQDTSGNATTATTATNVTVADTTDTTCFVGLFEADTGNLPPKSDAGMTYNAGTGTLTVNTDGGGYEGPHIVGMPAAKSTHYTLVLADAGKMIRMNSASANTLTIPNNSSVVFPIGTQILINVMNTGTTTIAGVSGVVLDSKDDNEDIDGRYSTVALIKTETNNWTLTGPLA